jgi:ATP-dependent DNA helicase RecQ
VEHRAAEDPGALDEDRDTIRRALSGVARARGAAGLQAVAAMLGGDRGPRGARAGLDRLSTFGVLQGRTPEQIMTVLRVLLANGWIDLTPGEYPVPIITQAGWRVLTGEIPLRVRLPPARKSPPARPPRPDRDRPTTVEDALARGMDATLFAALSAHRATVARAKALPPYVVAPNRTLTEIALIRPRCMEDLALVHGMGPGRLSAYGEGLLAVMRGGG